MPRKQLNLSTASLVYQGGIANVFNTSGGVVTRLKQDDFRTCEAFAAGLLAAGVEVTTQYCNQAGDVQFSAWSEDLDDAPFSDQFRPVGKFRTARERKR